MPAINAACQLLVVANRIGEHRQGEMARGEFEKGINRKIDLTLPFDARTVAAATNFGQPVAATRGPVATGLRELAERLCGPAPGTSPSRSNVWQKLLKKS
jgi:Flp pilus assembly CpaE family ATPase